MSAKSQFSRTLIAVAGAILMSTIAVSAAVTPLQASANPAQVVINA